jgi:coiled-coil domain-containing protein 130
VRARFRAEKKVEQARTAVDNELKDRYALPETLKLIRDDEASIAAAREEWRQANEDKRAKDLSQRGSALKAPIGSRPLSASSSSRSRMASPRDTVLTSLRERILENTARRNQTSVGRAAAGTFSKPKR